MLKRRLLFTLLWDRGAFVLSRNFRLQRVGDLSWLRTQYDFRAIAFSIDELVVLDVTRGARDRDAFARCLSGLSSACFVPIAAGGGLRTLEDARALLGAGADKLVVNTPLFDDPEFVRALARTYGSQCVVASIDYARREGRDEARTDRGTRPTGLSVAEAVARAEELGAGEIYLTSIDRDGTGQGLDLETLRRISSVARVPLVASGGVGRFDHLAEGVSYANVSAVSTANLFNFIGDGLVEARAEMRARGIPLAAWDAGFPS